MRFFLLLAAAAPLAAQCTYNPNPNTYVTGAGSIEGKITVSTQSVCVWTATSSVPWIQITNAQSFVGNNQSVSWHIDANTTTQVRNGTITVGDAQAQATIKFTQIAGDCAYQIVSPPATPPNYPVKGADPAGSFQVTAGCTWVPTASTQWITVTSPAPGVSILGNGTVQYSVAANTCVASRTGSITVNTGAQVPPPPLFTITQDGSPSNLTLSTNTASFASPAANGRVQVNTGQSCGWNSFSDVSWLTITANSGSGNGPGAVTFALSQNLGPTRTGHLNVGPATLTVVQTGVGAPPAFSAIVNAASGAVGPISPGEIVSLFGANMGPASGVAFDQTITTSLAGVQVMFGSLPAPLTYVSATQINAVVPYGLAGTALTQVQVQYQTQTSNIQAVLVQAATPAIFSADLTGKGSGAILNSDYTLNKDKNPATAGSVVMIYATGGGVTSPASVDGSPAPSSEPFARLALPVSVTIGGLPAQVTYSGGSPGLVSGLTQINAVVPAGVTGPGVPVLLQVGGFQSQTGLTLAVR